MRYSIGLVIIIIIAPKVSVEQIIPCKEGFNTWEVNFMYLFTKYS